MGRELRRVQPEWEHPEELKTSMFHEPKMGFIPLHDKTVDEAWVEWLAEFKASDEYYSEFCENWGTPPDPKYYRPEWDEEPTWFQVYETVSEGTPVTPPFATRDELIVYLVENGDYWDQKRSGLNVGKPWEVRAAQEFVNNVGWAPSGVILDGVGMRGHDMLGREK